MEYRKFGSTDMLLSSVGLGGLLAHYEGVNGHPPPEEKRRIYLRAAELGINLFDTGYGDEVHIPEELKGPKDDRYFSLKVGAPAAADLEALVDKHLTNLRRDSIDILRVHHYGYVGDAALAERIEELKKAGKVRSLCLIRHMLEDQESYAARGPESAADADLVIYNYVCRWQETGIEQAAAAGKGVLIMKALGGQWVSWQDKAQTDWDAVDESKVEELSPKGEGIRSELPLVYPIVSGPWHELAEPGEVVPRTERAVSWVLENKGVNSILVAFASVEELEEAVGVRELV
jgi:aryl-alcohol dehydrogenase-like predicted oxidoreductase